MGCISWVYVRLLRNCGLGDDFAAAWLDLNAVPKSWVGSLENFSHRMVAPLTNGATSLSLKTRQATFICTMHVRSQSWRNLIQSFSKGPKVKRSLQGTTVFRIATYSLKARLSARLGRMC